MRLIKKKSGNILEYLCEIPVVFVLPLYPWANNYIMMLCRKLDYMKHHSSTEFHSEGLIFFSPSFEIFMSIHSFHLIKISPRLASLTELICERSQGAAKPKGSPWKMCGVQRVMVMFVALWRGSSRTGWITLPLARINILFRLVSSYCLGLMKDVLQPYSI